MEKAPLWGLFLGWLMRIRFDLWDASRITDAV